MEGVVDDGTLVSRFDFWTAASTAVITAVTFATAVLTPPKSEPFCAEGCVDYPYTEIAAYIPGDFLWMYPALAVAPLFVMLLTGIHERASHDRKRFSRIGIAFAVMATTLLTADYAIQLRFVQPAVLRGELDGLGPWTQYNPHGVVIALEEAGYLLMATAFLFTGLALSRDTRLERIARLTYIGGFLLAVLLLVALSAVYGFQLEYRFEVAALTVDWAVVIITATLLAAAYRVPRSR
jgi:hypothetical protein